MLTIRYVGTNTIIPHDKTIYPGETFKLHPAMLRVLITKVPEDQLQILAGELSAVVDDSKEEPAKIARKRSSRKS